MGTPESEWPATGDSGESLPQIDPPPISTQGSLTERTTSRLIGSESRRRSRSSRPVLNQWWWFPSQPAQR